MFEKKHHKVVSLSRFAWRMVLFFGVAVGLLIMALLIGVAGYHWIAGFSIVDAILDASMILTGMGPVGELNSTPAKLFASGYAIFSGVVFITVMGVLLTPIFHRVLHKFHVDESDVSQEAKPPTAEDRQKNRP